MLAPLIPIPHGRKGTNLEGWSSLPPDELARKFQDNNGGNRGLRLDHYVSIDPDTPAAETVCETWEREGKLPPTWTWRTARGVIRRLYLRPQELLDTLTIEAISLQLRTGNKYYDVIPPSYVKDPKKGIDGFYTWLPDQDPYSISIAPLPQEILEYFKKHAGKGRLTQNTCERRSEPTGAHLDVEAYLTIMAENWSRLSPTRGATCFVCGPAYSMTPTSLMRPPYSRRRMAYYPTNVFTTPVGGAPGLRLERRSVGRISWGIS